ncbi:hypothetical protein PGRAN_11556 [Listeria grandensis FSL F6-0971]|uniref:Lipoprotein n=1 Tax=Listeria grandensis FSL F6-0971 TaxID=1265819 RepID=W7BRC0_9LIST|nr:hypothetical protein [Listeria grandensis]EUJ22788.1 hypothetical protein PGRAN_11556 [Listeria grandensis FSL F6-0971]
MQFIKSSAGAIIGVFVFFGCFLYVAFTTGYPFPMVMCLIATVAFALLTLQQYYHYRKRQKK